MARESATRAEDGIVRPLDGIRVLDVSHLTAGPMCTRFLSDAGAEVIKVEPPGGELARGMEPRLVDGSYADGVYFLRLAAGKQSVVLDLKAERGREAFLRLVEVSDILVEAFRPGTMGRLGLDYASVAERNPRIVYVSISGYGQPEVLDGPYADRPSYDPVVQAMSGVAHVTGSADGPPTWVGASIADTVPGMMAAYGALAALRIRDQTGQGTHVDVSQYDVMLMVNDRNIGTYLLTGEDPQRGRPVPMVPYGIFEAADGHVVVGVVSDKQWEAFCAVIGREDLVTDERTRSVTARRENWESSLKAVVTGWMRGHRRDDIVETMLAAGVPAGLVQSGPDIEQCPQVEARGMIRSVEHPRLGRLKMLGDPIKFHGIPPREMEPPPLLGADTERVLRSIAGLDEAEIALLIRET